MPNVTPQLQDGFDGVKLEQCWSSLTLTSQAQRFAFISEFSLQQSLSLGGLGWRFAHDCTFLFFQRI